MDIINKNSNNSELPKRVALLYSDAKREYFPTEDQYITEKDADKDAQIVAEYINKLGIETECFPGDAELTENLRAFKPDVAVNLVGSVKGSEFLSAAIPGLLELLEIPYTGAGILGESLDYNKFLIYKLLLQNGIPVANHQLFNTSKDPITPYLRYPLISKLNEIHGAVELTQDSVSENEKHLRNRINYLINTYKQPVLVEEFIVGREITAVLLEGLNKKVYQAEVVVNRELKYVFKTFEIQWIDKDPDAITYQKYDDPVLREYVKKAFSIIDMNDYGRFDIRMDNSGRYYFIDCNTNPYLGPIETGSPVTKTLNLYGVSFTETLKRILINTMRDAKGKERLPAPSSDESSE